MEEHIKDSILKEVNSMKSTKGIHIDLSTLEIKRLLDTDVLRSASFVREREQVWLSHETEMQMRYFVFLM